MEQSAREVRESLGRIKAGEVPDGAVYRRWMGHEWWVAGVSEGGEPQLKVLRFASGERGLYLFTDREALEVGRRAIRASEEGPGLLGDGFLSAEGLGVFRVLDGGLSWVEVNPHTPEALRLGREELLNLRRWTGIARLEALLEDPSREEAPFEVMRRFPWYMVALEGEGADVRDLLLAPDVGGRRLAAIFSAQDALDAFVEGLGGRLDARAGQATLTGEELFVSLKAMKLDGLVFNCFGPTRPRAFGVKVLDAILSGGGARV